MKVKELIKALKDPEIYEDMEILAANSTGEPCEEILLRKTQIKGKWYLFIHSIGDMDLTEGVVVENDPNL